MTHLAHDDLDPRHVQRLAIHEDDLARGGKRRDRDQPHRLPVIASYHLGAESGLAAYEVEVWTRLHDEGIVVLKGVAP